MEPHSYMFEANTDSTTNLEQKICKPSVGVQHAEYGSAFQNVRFDLKTTWGREEGGGGVSRKKGFPREVALEAALGSRWRHVRPKVLDLSSQNYNVETLRGGKAAGLWHPHLDLKKLQVTLQFKYTSSPSSN